MRIDRTGRINKLGHKEFDKWLLIGIIIKYRRIISEREGDVKKFEIKGILRLPLGSFATKTYK